MDEISVIVFADGDVIGHHPGAVALRQGYSSVDIATDDVQACIGRSLMDGDGVVDIGHGSYLVSAALRCLGLGVRPGGSVALLRSGVDEQASTVFHQADADRPVPPDAVNTALVVGWPGPAWAEPARVMTFPDPAPRSEWPVNVALRTIGVRRDGHPDEATALGLELPPPAGS